MERTRKMVEKYNLDINFLVKCRESNLYLIFTKVKCLKDMKKKARERYHGRLLLDETSNKQKTLKSLNQKLVSQTDTFKSNVKRMKSIYISYSINIVTTKFIKKVQ